jgi:peptidoglycan/LPS O-acetylase OafA/YrhL
MTISTTRDHLPQLDGVRALAIAGVIAYHLGYLRGGWIGVDVFFVLSGYLITSILLAADGHPLKRLKGFWGRRTRRLLPAVLLLLLVLSVYLWASGKGLIPEQLRAPGLATLFYTANWQEIVAGHGYFAQFSAPTPLQHTWSLAIEEQYYLIWPLLLGGLILITQSGRFRRPRAALIGATLILATASAVWMGVAAHLFGANRAYLGTDTRGWELLLGGALAMAWPPGRPIRSSGRRRTPLTSPRFAGAAGVVVGACIAGGPPGWIWDGGLVAIVICAALLIAGSVSAPANPVARLLTLDLVCWVGVISYSLYLWHWPVIVLMTSGTTGLSPMPLLAARLVTMLVAASASYYLVERPLRRLDWRALAGRLRVPVPGFATAGALATAVLIVVATVGPPVARSAPVSLAGLSSAPTATLSRLNLPPASRNHPYRVWIFGDSVMFDSSLGLQAALEATGEMSVVVNSSFPGWGLTRDHSWPTDARHIIATYHPQIVMATWSWDDQLAAEQPQAYLNRLKTAVRVLLTPGNGVQAVVLFQFPQTGPPEAGTDASASAAAWHRQTQQEQNWNELARKATMSFPGHALFLTTDQVFAPDGRYYTWMRTPAGGWIRARKVDNEHMCPYGAAEFGAVIVAELASQLRLAAMKPGWSTGAWTRATRYNQPAGACPADGPPPGYQGLAVPGVTPSD